MVRLGVREILTDCHDRALTVAASLPACNITLFGNYLRNQIGTAKYPRLIACTFSFVRGLGVR
jgi:hypothetical protein